jgi:enoyl-CoA hydratase/carnithine racemase
VRQPVAVRSLSTSTEAGASIFSVDVLDDGVAIIRMDDPAAKVNTLSPAFQEQVKPVIDRVQNDSSIKAAVLISGKANNFIAGADIKMIESCKSEAEVTKIVKEGHAMMNKMEGGKPIVAAINGQCLGGGLEVALAWFVKCSPNHCNGREINRVKYR